MDHFCYLCFVFVLFSCLFITAMHVATCWERAPPLNVMFCCVFVTFPCGVLGKAWCLIVSIPDLSLLSYYTTNVADLIKR